MPRIIKVLILILWMIIIFSFSQVNGKQSSGKSIGIIKTIVVKTSKVMYNIRIINKPISNKSAQRIANSLNYPARKCMHISEYFILAILMYNVLISYKVKRYYLFTFLYSTLYSISDEIHQLFTGRTGTFIDVFIDTIGILLAIFIIWHVNKNKTKKA